MRDRFEIATTSFDFHCQRNEARGKSPQKRQTAEGHS
jgi:hypothetical protein